VSSCSTASCATEVRLASVSFEPEAEFFDTLSFFAPGAEGVTSCSTASCGPEVRPASATFDPRVSTAASHAPEAQHVSFAQHAEFLATPTHQASFEPEAEIDDTLAFFGPGAGGVTSCSDAVMDYLEGPLAESFEFMFLPADDADDARA
jgi:hypothetical protein